MNNEADQAQTEQEEVSSEIETEQSKPEGDEAQMLLEDARAKADAHWDELLRARAEMENQRRRSQRDIENAHKYALDKFVQELLPVKDSLELGLAAISEQDEASAKHREGIELTLKMFGSVMEKFGIKELDPTGEAFNPEHHQAMSMQESAEAEPNTVLVVVQKGYLLNERLVRPAMVIVSKAAEAGNSTKTIDEKA
ncbi:MAG: nucleotide exchange factor GrpE [Gammaproteobacteria bacterium]|nr:nucleotide exchange factor GrpE [Gammaproteobacteria bacterium]